MSVIEVVIVKDEIDVIFLCREYKSSGYSY